MPYTRNIANSFRPVALGMADVRPYSLEARQETGGGGTTAVHQQDKSTPTTPSPSRRRPGQVSPLLVMSDEEKQWSEKLAQEAEADRLAIQKEKVLAQQRKMQLRRDLEAQILDKKRSECGSAQFSSTQDVSIRRLHDDKLAKDQLKVKEREIEKRQKLAELRAQSWKEFNTLHPEGQASKKATAVEDFTLGQNFYNSAQELKKETREKRAQKSRELQIMKVQDLEKLRARHQEETVQLKKAEEGLAKEAQVAQGKHQALEDYKANKLKMKMEARAARAALVTLSKVENRNEQGKFCSPTFYSSSSSPIIAPLSSPRNRDDGITSNSGSSNYKPQQQQQNAATSVEEALSQNDLEASTRRDRAAVVYRTEALPYQVKVLEEENRHKKLTSQRDDESQRKEQDFFRSMLRQDRLTGKQQAVLYQQQTLNELQAKPNPKLLQLPVKIGSGNDHSRGAVFSPSSSSPVKPSTARVVSTSTNKQTITTFQVPAPPPQSSNRLHLVSNVSAAPIPVQPTVVAVHRQDGQSGSKAITTVGGGTPAATTMTTTTVMLTAGARRSRFLPTSPTFDSDRMCTTLCSPKSSFARRYAQHQDNQQQHHQQ